MTHLAVPKTYKLFVGGAFPRSESGRTYPVHDAAGGFWANAALASRKDARDAVGAARTGFAAWSRATPYNRGQVIYRVAEMLEGRAAEFAGLLCRAGADAEAARREVEQSVERLVHHAGWTDKLAAVLGSPNAVSGPYTSWSVPEPVGVVAALAPAGAPLLGLVSVVAPLMATGNAAVVLAAEPDACVALTFAEVLATSDVPAGTVNLLTGRAAEVAPHLSAHEDVAALDLTGAGPELRTELERAAAETLTRVHVPEESFDPAAEPGLTRLRAFLEVKTAWHPAGRLALASGSGY